MNKPNRCGAKTRSGAPCKNAPAKGGKRCRFHGGASTGPKTREGKRRASHELHGAYGAVLDPEEVEAVAASDGALTDELTVARVQLRRALRAWNLQRLTDLSDLPADERTISSNADGDTETIRQRRPDLWQIIDRSLGRIGRLTEQQARLQELTGAAGADAAATAASIKLFLRGAMDVTGGPTGEAAYEPDPAATGDAPDG